MTTYARANGSGGWPFAATIGILALGAVLTAGQQQPSFRQAVDVIEFDVRVVTDKGDPIVGLTSDQFNVTLDGAPRRVVSAALAHYGKAAVEAPLAPARATPSPIWAAPKSVSIAQSSDRIFVLVVDAASFDGSTAGAVVRAARDFVGRLGPNDMVGLFVFPTGSQINPSTDRGRVMVALDRVTGQPAVTPGNEFNLRPSEVVALSPWLRQSTIDDAQIVPVGVEAERLMALICGVEPECRLRLRNEVARLVFDYERHSTTSLNLMRSLVQNLATIEGRKTLVLVSGGVATSLKPGGRPDIGNLDILIGQEAIRTNTSIYTLYVDWRFVQQSTSEGRASPRMLTSLGEDTFVLSRSLDQFSGAAGGAMFRAIMGTGEVGFDRILRETSAYYVLGVEPAEADRDGKPKQLSVKVNKSGATVRGSRWVTVPTRQ